MAKRATILLTNDDGYGAAGIKSLYRVLSSSYDVTVVAPESEQSGVSHSFTYRNGVTCTTVPFLDGVSAFAVSGTPADCVKFGIAEILNGPPDFVVSGMNIGENTGISGYYSGTVAAAREGAFWGIRSLAFSVCSRGASHIDSWAATAADMMHRLAVSDGAPFAGARGATFLNVNFPAGSPRDCRGVVVTRQSMAYFDDSYRLTPRDGEPSLYELAGDKKNVEESDEFDSRAIRNGLVTVTPLHFDATATDVMPRLATLAEAWRIKEHGA